MKTDLHEEVNSQTQVGSFARRSYKIYLEHFRSRNLKPTLTMDEFMKNYSAS